MEDFWIKKTRIKEFCFLYWWNMTFYYPIQISKQCISFYLLYRRKKNTSTHFAKSVTKLQLYLQSSRSNEIGKEDEIRSHVLFVSDDFKKRKKFKHSQEEFKHLSKLFFFLPCCLHYVEKFIHVLQTIIGWNRVRRFVKAKCNINA